MALNQAQIITVTSVKGGTGKTTLTLCLAGILSLKKKKTIIVDFDMHAGTIAASLNVPFNKDLYVLTDDIGNNRFGNIEDYIFKYNDFIDVLPAPKDPRNAYKINSKYVSIILDYLRFKYDVILIDTNHIIDNINLITFDHSDTIIYSVTSDLMDLKNMKTMLSIYQDMSSFKYVLVLNEALNRELLTSYDASTILGVDIKYVIPKSFYMKNMQKVIQNGEVLTFLPYLQKSKGYKVLENLVNDVLKG